MITLVPVKWSEISSLYLTVTTLFTYTFFYKKSINKHQDRKIIYVCRVWRPERFLVTIKFLWILREYRIQEKKFVHVWVIEWKNQYKFSEFYSANDSKWREVKGISILKVCGDIFPENTRFVRYFLISQNVYTYFWYEYWDFS